MSRIWSHITKNYSIFNLPLNHQDMHKKVVSFNARFFLIHSHPKRLQRKWIMALYVSLSLSLTHTHSWTFFHFGYWGRMRSYWGQCLGNNSFVDGFLPWSLWGFLGIIIEKKLIIKILRKLFNHRAIWLFNQQPHLFKSRISQTIIWLFLIGLDVIPCSGFHFFSSKRLSSILPFLIRKKHELLDLNLKIFSYNPSLYHRTRDGYLSWIFHHATSKVF